MWFQFKRIHYLPRFYSIIIIVLLFLQTYRFADTEINRLTLGEPIAWYLQSMCGAITSLNYGRGGYVCYKNVYEKLKNVGWTEKKIDAAEVKRTFQQILLIKDPGRDGFDTVGGTDTGFIDYCRLAFLLFGYKTEGLFYLYFILSFISIALFFITFRKNSAAIFTLIIFLLAHFIAVSGVDRVIGSIHSYRFITVLAILPLIHILMLSLFNRPLTFFSFAGAVIQSLAVVFILWIRNSILWIVVFLICLTIFRIFAGRYRQIPLTQRINKMWPIFIALFFVLLFKITTPHILDPEYKKETSGTSRHVFWHSIYLGLALHPEIRGNYSTGVYDHKHYGINRGERVHGPVCSDEYMQGHPAKVAVKTWLCADRQRWLFEIIYAVKHPIEYQPNDQDGLSAAFKWLYDRGRSEYELFNFQPEDDVDYKKAFPHWFRNGSVMNKKRSVFIQGDFQWGRYDSILKDVVKDVVRNQPLQVAQNLFIDKPVRFLQACFRYFSATSLPIWFLLIVVVHFYMIEIEQFRNEIFQVLKLVIRLFIFSLIPVFVAYPGDYLIADSILILTMVFLIAVFLITIPKVKNILLREKSEAKNDGI